MGGRIETIRPPIPFSGRDAHPTFPAAPGDFMRFMKPVRIARAFLPLLTLALLPTTVSATWSVIAVDARTGRVVIASATCVPQSRLLAFPAKGLMDIQAIVVPGVGVAAAQAGVDRTRTNQTLIYEQLVEGTDPRLILDMLRADPEIERRQFAIVDLRGRSIGFSGRENNPASLAAQGRVPGTDIYYSVQGNILASDAVVQNAARALQQAEGDVLDKVMAAMEAADDAGGDRRCTCETEPVPDAECDGRNAHVAYILAADANDPRGSSFNDGDYFMFIDVTDENIEPHENGNPVITLRMRYDQWKSSRGAP
jgi:uncharacterized Ntn-hydrolase superfamily protein